MKINYQIFSFLILSCFFVNAQDGARLLYNSESFKLFGNRVEQGEYVATAKSEQNIVSNYQSPANAFFKPEIAFKFSINGKDNEAPSGIDHIEKLKYEPGKTIVVRRVFGQTQNNPVLSTDQLSFLPANTPIRIELDMQPVLSAFEKDGYYTDFRGNKIYKADFKGVFIAGTPYPLKWDFDNLVNFKELQLHDNDGDGIYTNELLFNVFDSKAQTDSEWELSKDLSKYPAFSSNFKILNALYNLSLEEMLLDIRDDRAFMAGKEWPGVWTRDISYSIILGFAMIEPEVSKNSLLHKVKNKRIIQDTGTGGSWPVSTDRQVWAIAAWEVYKATGDNEWLKQAYEIISNSMLDDLKTAFNPETGLFYGESSFLDWRKQTYPEWMEPVDIYRSHCLGTNALFFETLNILHEMGQILGIANAYNENANKLKLAINEKLWVSDKNYYGQFLYGQVNYSLSPRSEALGEALCVLYNIAGENRKKQVLENTPVLEFGIPCIYPQIPGIPPYHNEGVWPFVQAYWTIAGARNNNSAIVEHGLAAMYRQAALFLTNKENMVAVTGDFNGTEINSSRQLWSVAGNLSMVYKVLFGMEMQANKLTFSPFVPEIYKGNYFLKGFVWRNAKLNISLDGFGNGISSFEIDGVKYNHYSIPENLEGEHNVKIIMNGITNKSELNRVKNLVSPAAPNATLSGTELSWTPVKDAEKYRVYKNGKALTDLNNLMYNIELANYAEYQVSAIDFSGTESFLCRPMGAGSSGFKSYEAEEFASPTEKKVFGFYGGGCVDVQKENSFKFNLMVVADGEYIVKFRYANGHGPTNTDNKCGIRALYCNSIFAGASVFPQRGTNEWSNWGYSNPIKVKLNKGLNQFELRFESFTENMNVDVNDFLIDQILLIAN